MMAVHVQRMYTISIEYLLLQSKQKKFNTFSMLFNNTDEMYSY